MHSWQNGTRCRDGVNVLRCSSHLVWLVFEGSCDLFLLFFFKNCKRREVGKEDKGKMHGL